MNSDDKAKNQEQLEAHQRLALSPFHTLLGRQKENQPTILNLSPKIVEEKTLIGK